MTMKRTRNFNNSPDKLADKSVKLDIHVKCNNAATDDYIECYWCAQWEHRSCAAIKESELAILDAISQNILFFCISCLLKLPSALTLFENQSQFNEKLGSRLQSVEDVMHQRMSNMELALSNKINSLSSQIEELEAKHSNNL